MLRARDEALGEAQVCLQHMPLGGICFFSAFLQPLPPDSKRGVQWFLKDVAGGERECLAQGMENVHAISSSESR